MPLRLYNTLTKREEEFVPLDPAGKVVTMYTCGPTVYGRPHVGNYASFLMADLLRRWLEYGHGYRVRHVKNITDVGHLLHDADQGDDKIQREAEREKSQKPGGRSLKGKSARAEGIVSREDILGVVETYTRQFLDDERALNMLEPEARPRASTYVKEQLAMIDRLVAKGHAYELDDGIYFSVESFSAYGSLSGNTLDNLCAGARVAIDAKKKHPADFALWKKCVGENAKHILRWSTASGEVSRSSGEDPSSGFPGWHIECSAMSSSILGDRIDLHTGGEDNIFPHHECEIAQSECATGARPFVRTWVHRRRIQMGDEKMSKSLGNVKTIPDITALGCSPLDLRYYLLSVHYRTHLKFTEKGLDEARKLRRGIAEWTEDVRKQAEHGERDTTRARRTTESMKEKDAHDFLRRFREAMDADLNVSEALAVVLEAMSWSRVHDALGAFGAFAALARSTFGCFDAEEEAIPSEALALAEERDAARARKDFAASDRLRARLIDMGYEVRDTEEGTRLKKN